MEGFEKAIFVWAKDDAGNQHFCQADCLRDLDRVGEGELGCCVSYDPRDEAR